MTTPPATAAYAIRPLTAAQLPLAAQIVRVSFSGIARTYGITRANYPAHAAFLSDEQLRDEFLSGVEMFGLYTYEAPSAGELAGFLSVSRRGGVHFVDKLCVLPKFRGRGYGAALIGHLRGRMRREGGWIMLGAIHKNKRLVSWYRKNGFRQIAVEHYGGIPHAVSLMALRVPAAKQRTEGGAP